MSLDAHTLDALIGYAAEWTGFSRDAILPEAVRRAAVLLGPDLLQRAARREPAVVHDLCQAVSVGETFFFRQPEHFRFVAQTLLPELAGRAEVRAWSAGCATGEEAYSLAACLLDLAPAGVSVSVLGTDLLERNLAAARKAEYGAWSRRESGPMLHPLLATHGTRATVSPRVREVTKFQQHNLLQPPPGQFELIFCRNVLVYFSPGAVHTVVGHLAQALVPGGALCFGSMDLGEQPPGLVRWGQPELLIYRRPLPVARATAQPAPPPAPALPYVPRVKPPEPVALHLRALVHIERGDRKIAAEELASLNTRVPDYVPGLLERALLHVRQGERSAAQTLMREVLRKTEKLPADELLPGPEPLPVSFYRSSAETFLKRGGA